ncbi:putative guanyl-specific ribonuclease f1 [Erysiphe neolycopersici]|uniref:Putative guanyl-specific ribonuclease f1 n=1 Tax=Erysiphe neolycopersici TaxID=212602 RepID=A0A420HSB2_9PEZI|nr:putative guanyl-specific ribonuclease f1 [Erysiphe neolycopersici]
MINNTDKPLPPFGRVYPDSSGYLIWSITKRKYFYKLSNTKPRRHLLVLKKERQAVDIVVRGFFENLLRCIRSRKVLQTPVSDQLSKLFVPPPKSGYLCS